MARAQRESGGGLGLVIVQRILSLHGSDIRLLDRPGRGAAAVGLVAVLLALGTGARRPMWNALAGLVIGLVVAAPPINMMRRAHQLPSIHDISTDTDNPPAFDAVVPLRHGARNPVEYVP